MQRRQPTSTLFPYTTLFRSVACRQAGRRTWRSRSAAPRPGAAERERDRKSTRLNSSHVAISYAVVCLKKKQIKKLMKNITQRGHIIPFIDEQHKPVGAAEAD